MTEKDQKVTVTISIPVITLLKIERAALATEKPVEKFIEDSFNFLFTHANQIQASLKLANAIAQAVEEKGKSCQS